MTTNDTVKLNINGENIEFVKGTYNGMTIIKIKNLNFINASKFTKQYNKRLGRIFESKNWNEFIITFEHEYYPEFKRENEGKSTMANLPPWSKQFNKGIPDSLKQYRGLYVDERLINYIAFLSCPQYAIYVGKVMDSINDKVHEQLEKQSLPDTVENAKPIFNQTVEEIQNHLVSDNENSQCWGIRERDKFDYLDSWDKSWVKSEFELFKKHLIDKLSLTYEELKRDYPQLIE